MINESFIGESLHSSTGSVQFVIDVLSYLRSDYDLSTVALSKQEQATRNRLILDAMAKGERDAVTVAFSIAQQLKDG